MRDLTYSESRRAEEQTQLAVNEAYAEVRPFTYHHAFRLNLDIPVGTLAPRDIKLRTPFRQFL